MAASTKIRIHAFPDDGGPESVILRDFTYGTGAAGEPLFPDAAGNLTLPGTLTVAGTLAAPEVEEVATGITAFATGGQASATVLTARHNNITTCASAGDSVKLPTAVAGTILAVKNSGAATLAVFPNTSDSINALAVNLSVDVPVGATAEFLAISAAVWETQESLYLPAPTTQTGGIEVKAADSAGNTTTTITNASQAAARTYTIPDGGASANFLLSQGAQTVAGAQTFTAALITGANNGAAGTNCTAVENGDGYHHTTILTLTAAELTPTIPANAEGAGAIIYTFPAGVYVVDACHMDITAGVMDTATNAADLGVGSLIASGDIATLTTAAMEDYVTGQTVADVSSFVAEKSTIPTAGASLLFEAGDSHVAHINVAGTWNATVATASVTGTVTIAWRFLGA